MSINNTWKVIINPYAGGNSDSMVWERILHELNASQILFDYELSQYHGHIIELVKQSIVDGYRKYIIIGGDGSLSEAVNGIYNQNSIAPDEVITAHISLGTGNDWQRTHQLPTSTMEMITRIMAGNTEVQDVGVVTYQQNNETLTRYYINVAGMGFDAYVVQNTPDKKENKTRTKFTYLFSLFRSLMSYRCLKAKVAIDGQQVFGGEMFSLSVGIGKFNGGGIMQLPDAVPNDGILDCTIFRKMTKLKVILNVKRLYDGSFCHLKEVSFYKGTHIRIEATIPLAIECDGELLGNSPAKFTIIKNGFRFIL